MKTKLIIPLVVLLAAFFVPRLNAADLTRPLVSPGVVFEEVNGILAVEAEHFYKQTLSEKRSWHITSPQHVPDVKPDPDPPHLAGASGGAYVEILPDTRVTHADRLIHGENFSNKPGVMAVLHYKVHFNNPGRYYVWVRAYSTGAEDNGLHVGFNDEWPASGQRLQWCDGKNTWRWESKQRTEQEHCGVPFAIYLDIPSAGEHEILFSMREDGFEMDKFVLARSRDFKPEAQGPEPKVKAGRLPAPFPAVAETPVATPQPAAQARPALKMNAADFPTDGTGYYLDGERWMAIEPSGKKEARTASAFPFPSGRYHVTLQTIGENDGRSTYQAFVNGQKIGEFTAPLAREQFEEGPAYHVTWNNIEVNGGDVVEVASTVGSLNGDEFSRGRWAALVFDPANAETRKAVANFVPAKPVRPAAPVRPALVEPRQPNGTGAVEISGELKQWHKVTLTLDGPFAHEMDTAPNPFTDYNLTVTFTHESGSPKYRVPGYFAADGDAAETSADSGTKWRAHLSPDQPGGWTYEVSLHNGQHAALGERGEALQPFHGRRGDFTVAPTDKSGRDFRAKGRLQYVGKHYLQFAGTKDYFLKAGPDAPETFLGYAEFDNTQARRKNVPLKTWTPHLHDWREGDPAWQSGKGKGIIGALNYLASKGVNAFSFLTYNAGGDGDNVWPFVHRDEKLNYDVSKLAQWGIVFDHAQGLGLYLHFKTQETENDDLKGPGAAQSLDGGDLGPERKLYFRELIARFGHALALNWNFGEENTQTTEQQVAMIGYVAALDPYQHLRVIHTYPNEQDKVYAPLLGNKSELTGASLQNHWDQTHRRTLKWVRESAAAGKPWVAANDEQGGADTGVPPDLGYQGYDGRKSDGTAVHSPDDIRKATLWGNLMAGGAGVEYYFGYQLPENDLTCEDFRSRDRSWDWCRIAIEFFHGHKIPFWEMQNANRLAGNKDDNNSKFCFAKAGEVYLVYLANGGTTELDLSGATGHFGVQWFNPRAGGPLQDGPVKSVQAGGQVSVGNPPSDPAQDWVVLVRRTAAAR
jgi:hypothetical protein